ncbi:MAG: heat shock protein HspQ [Acidobacteriota bacterium]
MSQTTCKFNIGQLICHRLFDYRGVIVDVDATFLGTEEWYEEMAKSQPPRDQPWYHVLVDDAEHTTYVAERNLKSDQINDPINHPLLDHFFSDFRNGRYIRIMN